MPFGVDINTFIGEVIPYLEEVTFPVDKAELIDQVAGAGAPDHIVSGLDEIPDGIYERVSDVTEVLAQKVQMH
ncbi:MAG: DUF2795 domain-containing protein [Candidatus Hydrogenedentes bacterium]|nr:DUF2795 domain-containing protein [Candidatus Hydrogenedentota bacterium]